MDDGSRMRLLVVARGPIGEITGILADGWYQVIFPSPTACASDLQ
jgi:hypothetical protein